MASEIDIILKYRMLEQLADNNNAELYAPDPEDEMFEVENYEDNKVHKFYSLAGVEKYLGEKSNT